MGEAINLVNNFKSNDKKEAYKQIINGQPLSINKIEIVQSMKYIKNKNNLMIVFSFFAYNKIYDTLRKDAFI